MLFPTFEFFWFFAVVLFFNWALKRWPLLWKLFLLGMSYFFYSVWEVRFVLILIAVSIINYFAVIICQKVVFRFKKAFFVLALFINIGVLGLFKYYDFFRVSTETLLRKFGFAVNLPLFEFILPIGISFYLFRAISYLIDVYRQKIIAEKSWLDFFLYLAFFPHLLAGPIARAGDFLPQLKNGGARLIETPRKYFTLIFVGFFKKVVISSFLTSRIVDNVLAVPENHAAQIVIIAVLSYSLVIYFDFSGYSDMAIGFAGLLGFRSPDNFNFPYLSQNLRDFWRRWHISFSNWIRDYVYIPLGGNRKGKLREYLNLFLSMTVVGLWHGAAGHFVVWGALHGLGMPFSDLLGDKIEKTQGKKTTLITQLKNYLKKSLNWLLTFVFITFSWVFFRSENLEESFRIFVRMTDFSARSESIPLYILILIGMAFLFVFLEHDAIKKINVFQEKMPTFVWSVFVVGFVILLFSLSPYTIPPFIYFSF